MNANRKTATVHHLPKAKDRYAAVVKLDTDRNIIVTYFVDGARNIVSRVSYYKYPRAAVMKATDYMSMDVYSAVVCQIYDDENGRLHTTLTYDGKGKVIVQHHVDVTDASVAGLSSDPFGDFARKRAKTFANKFKKTH